MTLNNVFSGLMNSGAATGLATGLVGGLAGSLLTTKTGRKFGKNALKLGGAAAVGALAYGAYKKYSNLQNSSNTHHVSDPPRDISQTNFLPDPKDTRAMHKLELILVKAMLSASRADGEVELAETQMIFNQIRAFNLDQREEIELINQFNKPTNIVELIQAADKIEVASEIYTVSCMVIEEANTAEREYLNLLADRLGLPKELAAAIEAEVGNQKLKLVA